MENSNTKLEMDIDPQKDSEPKVVETPLLPDNEIFRLTGQSIQEKDLVEFRFEGPRNFWYKITLVAVPRQGSESVAAQSGSESWISQCRSAPAASLDFPSDVSSLHSHTATEPNQDPKFISSLVPHIKVFNVPVGTSSSSVWTSSPVNSGPEETSSAEPVKNTSTEPEKDSSIEEMKINSSSEPLTTVSTGPDEKFLAFNRNFKRFIKVQGTGKGKVTRTEEVLTEKAVITNSPDADASKVGVEVENF